MKKPALKFSAEARDWRRKLVAAYGITDPAGVLILDRACEAFDEMRQAQREVTANGMTAVDRFGQRKPNPAVLMVRDSRTALVRCLKALNLDFEPPRGEEAT
jgi:P27 family predicted phage terminase small subunit